MHYHNGTVFRLEILVCVAQRSPFLRGLVVAVVAQVCVQKDPILGQPLWAVAGRLDLLPFDLCPSTSKQ